MSPVLGSFSIFELLVPNFNHLHEMQLSGTSGMSQLERMKMSQLERIFCGDAHSAGRGAAEDH
eukprot:1639723-Rhodomonas_salina.3